ncbi:arsenate reductase (glutaredoxin) [Cellvibrio sp. KY-GH-1]|uniref:arsenate reductase (glutaredoxin) n=1 Tax=Cellvibrio sp. KY-GH-1 TaxID=2303332 RepID=UPI0012475363|nr:arsenate reductase (glutaredoxin) [Cellvibrio sp. KY-GH-1]QEY14659.1 arsenate reductase (glutaredoxin) [Cellvibrio sp. KY-GH-1]
MITLYHNPRCSKSRDALSLLRAKGVEPEVILYLETPPSAKTLKALLAKLGMSARDLLRKGEDAYKELNLADEKLSEAALIKAMVENPKLIERPIGVQGDKAAIGRPPENILTIL